MQLEKTELGLNGIPAKMLEGASTGSGVDSLAVPLGLFGSPPRLDLAAVSQSHHCPSCRDLWKPSEVIELDMVSGAGSWEFNI